MLQRIWETIQQRVTSSQVVRLGVSLMIALFLWGWVTLLEDPVETQQYAEIAMTAPDLPGTLQIVTTLPRATVAVTDVSSRLDELSRSDITVTIDTSSIHGPGSYQLDVIAETTDRVRKIKVSPDTVSVQIEEEISRSLPLTVENQQLADDARRIIDINPEVSQVTVTGTESAINRIAKVVLPVTIRDQTTDFIDMIEPYAVDKESQRIQEVQIVPAHVRTEVVLEKRGKTVSVVPQVSGSPADGFVVQQQVSVPATVIVDGPKDELDKLLFVSTAQVDISGATESVSESVPLVGLPEGVTLVDPPENEVEVRVAIGASSGTGNLIPDMPIEVLNLRDGLTVRLDPDALNISVSAPAEQLSALTADDIRITVDVAGLGPGVYTLTPDIEAPENVTIANVEPQRVVVLIADDTATPAASPAAGVSASVPTVARYWEQ
jgi:YbbR domain-containing protein